MTERMHASETAAPEWLRSVVRGLENDERLDRVAEQFDRIAAPIAEGPRGDTLRGRRLGHALHPLLTDFPMGCWLSAGLLDLLGGRRSRKAAQRLVGLGLLATVPTAATGMAEWTAAKEHDPRIRRVGVVHGMGNLVVGAMYWRSWRSRRRGHHLRGIVWGLAGGTMAWGTGWLGGHLALAYGAGDGERGMETSADQDRQATGGARVIDLREASELLGVPEEQIHRMVDQGLLVPVDGEHGAQRFRDADVEAVRLLGG
jgi:uncharacterized membrane protein